MTAPAIPTFLPHDTFLGRRRLARQAGDFAFAHLEPTVPEERVARHTHPEAHGVLVLAGRYLSTAAGAPAVAGAGTFIYNPPGTTHRDRFRGVEGRFFTIALPAGLMLGLAGALALPDHPIVADGAAAAAAGRLAVRSRAEDAGRLELESLGFALLDAVAGAAARARGALPPWLKRARALLRDAGSDDLALGEVARVVGVHPVHLTREFRRHFRVTPGEYLRRGRLNRAAALLAAGRLSLLEVGLACGYYDQAHFSRSFRQAFGLSPREYRMARGRRLTSRGRNAAKPDGPN